MRQPDAMQLQALPPPCKPRRPGGGSSAGACDGGLWGRIGPWGCAAATPQALVAAVVLATLLLATLPLAGCGYKAPPRPSEEVLLPPDDVRVRPRADVLLVSWAAPPAAAAGEAPPALGYEVTLEHLPAECPHCPPTLTRRVAYAAEAGELTREGSRLYATLAWPSPTTPLRIQVTAIYPRGRGRPSSRLSVHPAAQTAQALPAPSLTWRWVGPAPTGAAPPRPVRLSWEAEAQGQVQVLGADGKPTARSTAYRANVYRRDASRTAAQSDPQSATQPWPLTPLNPEPLTTPPWIDAPFAVPEAGTAPSEVRYVLRWVDPFGNEGPASAEVTVRRDSAP